MTSPAFILTNALVALAVQARTQDAAPATTLVELSRRLHAGDVAAIDELLARTKPATLDLAESNARIERLRAEIERLDARRLARPSFPIASESPMRRADAASAGDAAIDRRDSLRESHAWLRAGEPERALAALPAANSSAGDEDEATYLEARALEKLGRRDEALDGYRRLAASATSTVLRLRAAGDVAHLEWLERVRARESRP